MTDYEHQDFPNIEPRPTEPGSIESLADALDIANGRSDAGSSIDPLTAEELRQWGRTPEGQDTIDFFRKISGLE